MMSAIRGHWPESFEGDLPLVSSCCMKGCKVCAALQVDSCLDHVLTPEAYGSHSSSEQLLRISSIPCWRPVPSSLSNGEDSDGVGAGCGCLCRAGGFPPGSPWPCDVRCMPCRLGELRQLRLRAPGNLRVLPWSSTRASTRLRPVTGSRIFRPVTSFITQPSSITATCLLSSLLSSVGDG